MKGLLRLGAAAVLCASMSVSAETDDVKTINKYGQVGLWNTHSAKTLKKGCLNINVHGMYTSHEDYIVGVKGVGAPDSTLRAKPDFNKADIHVAIGYGFTNFLDFSAMIPIYVDRIPAINFTDATGSTTYQTDNTNKGGAGDIELSLKFQYPPYQHKEFFRMAYFGGVSIPTGQNAKGRFPRKGYYLHEDNSQGEVVSFFSGNNPEVDMKMLWTWDFRELSDQFPVLFHMNYGLRWTTNSDLDHHFSLNAGLEVRPKPWFSIFLDYSAEPGFGHVEQEEVTLANGVTKKMGPLYSPMRLAPGIFFLTPGGLTFSAGAQISVANSDNHFFVMEEKGQKVLFETAVEPKAAFAASIGWNGFVLPQDKDGDKILDKDDACPSKAEDFDGFKDEDGCPEEDNDNDGIKDADDKCPNDREDLDNFEDEDGCPEADNDKDGLADAVDKCPNDAEDMDGFEDEDGCPEDDDDTDGDGILNKNDICPDKPEDKDNFEDSDGCPEDDNDKDGILDAVDKCPNQPETLNGFQDEDGCPDKKKVVQKAAVIKRGAIVLEGVNFMSGKAVLTSGSYAVLDEVIKSLKDWPEITIRIEGHTDSVGSATYNKQLSYKRARAVLDYFVSQGVKGSRVSAVGKGEESPKASNQTASGRAENRRVELHRTDK